MVAKPGHNAMRANHKRVRIIRLSFFYCHTQPGHQRLARRPTLLGGVLSPQTSSLAFVVCRRISHIDHLRTSISRICLGTPPPGGVPALQHIMGNGEPRLWLAHTTERGSHRSRHPGDHARPLAGRHSGLAAIFTGPNVGAPAMV